MVVTPYAFNNSANNTSTSGYVLIGRSLREIDKRIDQLTLMSALALAAALLLSFLVMFFFAYKEAVKVIKSEEVIVDIIKKETEISVADEKK